MDTCARKARSSKLIFTSGRDKTEADDFVYALCLLAAFSI